MKISELMSPNAQVVGPDQPIREAAQFMLSEDAGAMPVCDGERLIGMVTDRDIAVRAVAEGRGPDTLVRDVMTEEALFCWEDDDVETVAARMSDAQVRRFPVVSRSDQRLVGIVSLGDLSQSDRDDAAQTALEGITEPGGEHSQGGGD
jgi:CBS domain-containing protein